MSGFLVRPARLGEEDVVLDLLAEAAAWLRSRGIEQWPPRFPEASVSAQIEAGEAFLVLRSAQPVATVAITGADLWGDGEPAHYLSRLAVARSSAGLGRRILDWADARAAAAGRRYLRLATTRDNPALRRYYERAGFRHVGDPPDARWPTSHYEREVTPRP